MDMGDLEAKLIEAKDSRVKLIATDGQSPHCLPACALCALGSSRATQVCSAWTGTSLLSRKSPGWQRSTGPW